MLSHHVGKYVAHIRPSLDRALPEPQARELPKLHQRSWWKKSSLLISKCSSCSGSFAYVNSKIVRETVHHLSDWGGMKIITCGICTLTNWL